jgi:uncharacterized protein
LVIVLDTNILVSALLTPFGNPARILDMIIRGELTLLYDDRILSEYREVLARKTFSFEKHDIEILLEYIETECLRINAAFIDEQLPDNDDLPFLEVALGGKADALVTGNKRHFRGKTSRVVHVVNPDEFLQLLRKKEKSRWKK